jgi:hypothetical protein
MKLRRSKVEHEQDKYWYLAIFEVLLIIIGNIFALPRNQSGQIPDNIRLIRILYYRR